MLRSVCALTAAARQPYVFTVPPVDQVLDLHGNPRDSQLAIFMAGNKYMVMPALLAAFRRAHPEIRSIYYETLPPGVDARQIAAGALQMGNLVIDTQADVFLSGRRRMLRMHEEGYVSSSFPYASNVLAIMVRKGNAKHVESLRDLGRADVRVSMPNARWEGVEEQIEQAYRKAGGEALVNAIMRRKLAAGAVPRTHRLAARFRAHSGRGQCYGGVHGRHASFGAASARRAGVSSFFENSGGSTHFPLVRIRSATLERRTS